MGISDLTENELKRLYLEEKQSSREIAKMYGSGKSSVLSRMKKLRISARSRVETSRMIVHPIKYHIPKNVMFDLYYKENLSTYQIAEKYGCSPAAIYHKMRKMYKIPLRNVDSAINMTIERRSRNIAKSVTKYAKRDFSGDLNEKSYLIGFRLGDLNVRKNKYGQTIIVQTWSTKKSQLDLLRSLFEKYGHVYQRERRDGNSQFVCCLNTSFDFLLKKEDGIDDWILNNDSYFLEFLAGYIDAEGHFGVHNGFAEFSVSTNDKNIINMIYAKLSEMGINGSKPRVTVSGGYVDKRGIITNHDMWRFRITKKKELYKFICLAENFIRHEKRRSDAFKAKENAVMRLKEEK